MENSTKYLIGFTALAVVVTAAIVLSKKKGEKTSNVAGPRHGGGHGGRPRVGIRNIYGGSYAFPYTPLYGYDQCTFADKNGAVIVAPCNSAWSRSW